MLTCVDCRFLTKSRLSSDGESMTVDNLVTQLVYVKAAGLSRCPVCGCRCMLAGLYNRARLCAVCCCS
jgi:hypothetical protein